MTREVAIDSLKADIIYWEDTSVSTDPYYMAIQALEKESVLDKITEIIEPLRHLSIDETSNIEWQILQLIDKNEVESEEKNI